MIYICALRDGCVIAYWKMESHTHSTQRQQHPYFSDAGTRCAVHHGSRVRAAT